MPLTQKEYARRKKVTPQYVNKLVRQGKIALNKGKIDAAKADKALAAWKRAGRIAPSAASKQKSPAASSPAGSAQAARQASATMSLTAARAASENYKARMSKLEYEKAVGSLLPKAEVLEAERRKNANIRTRFRRLARSLAPQLARGRSPAEIEELLLSEIDLQLQELAADPLGAAISDAPAPIPESEPPMQTFAALKPLAEISPA